MDQTSPLLGLSEKTFWFPINSPQWFYLNCKCSTGDTGCSPSSATQQWVYSSWGLQISCFTTRGWSLEGNIPGHDWAFSFSLSCFSIPLFQPCLRLGVTPHKTKCNFLLQSKTWHFFPFPLSDGSATNFLYIAMTKNMEDNGLLTIIPSVHFKNSSGYTGIGRHHTWKPADKPLKRSVVSACHYRFTKIPFCFLSGSASMF